MAFQDFGDLSERRRREKQQRLKQKITVAVISVLVLILIIASCVVAIVYRSGHNAKKQETAGTTKQVTHSTNGIKMICDATDFKQTCESKLGKIMSSNSTNHPKDLLKAAIFAIIDEIETSFLNVSSKFKTDNPDESKALDDCHILLGDAIEELDASADHVGGNDIEKLPQRTHDLDNWLSAVMSYQETCIDGFPDGKLKSDIQKAFKTAKELTSNSLAIVSEMTTILSALQVPGLTHRRLLGKEENDELSTIEKDKRPNWMSHEDRRALQQAPGTADLKPNVVVAKDGSGAFKTISEALAAMPAKYTGRYIIYVKTGVYDETVTVGKKMVNVTMYGDGPEKTVVTGSKNFVDGVRTFQTATFVALGDGFMARDMCFKNTAGPEKHQAVALRVQSDRSVFYNCRIDGYQDTLYTQTHRQFYTNCTVLGTIDFIFGDASAIIQDSTLIVRRPLDNQQNSVTAQGRADKRETTGLVIQNCIIKANYALLPVKFKIKSYLGRPWKEYSRTIIMESMIGNLIAPEGWMPWQGDFALKTLNYVEYENKGPGAATGARVKWPGYKSSMTKDEAMKYTVEPFLGDWVKPTGVPVQIGLYGK
ncbi:pectinesterase-like [Papaver somniferum]|uniref:pectinesterase-like n=1 Tax=Papaver somniferum TaxID=3469 RepID=UPI000E6FCF7A|nr:pectinesterase-like [Papaver somniferum]